MVQACENVFVRKERENSVEIIANTTEFQLNRDTAVAIGKFDGIHIGHQKLLGEVRKRKEEGLATCVFTFDPPPHMLFGPKDRKVLSTREEQRVVFEKLGVDILIEFPLNWETAGIEPEVFARKILATQMRVKYLAAGTDLSFGARGAGNAALLQKLAPELGFEVETIEKVYLRGEEVSSTWLRSCVERGEMEVAEELLGTSYMVSGKVVGGKQLGRKLGFPTINVIPEEDKLLPPCGVYFSEVVVDGGRYAAISNVGYKPTVTEEKKLGVETFLYGFERMIYGENVEVYLKHFHRNEQRFSGVEALRKQLEADISIGEKFHNLRDE